MKLKILKGTLEDAAAFGFESGRGEMLGSGRGAGFGLGHYGRALSNGQGYGLGDSGGIDETGVTLWNLNMALAEE